MGTSRLSIQEAERLAQLYKRLQEKSGTFIGYPCSLDFDYSELYNFFDFAINNVGDPFVSSNYQVNTHEIEREVLEFFAEITDTKHEYWGYVTNGGTEGNMYGLYLARELYPDAIVYYSQDTHYSVTKILRLLNIKNIMIRSLDNGEIDYQDLEETIRIKRDVIPIVVANIGTTMKGAVDNIEKIHEILEDLAMPDHYIHCDAALSGMLLPFLQDAPGIGLSSGIDSFSISGHKFIGSPIPCGVTLAKRRNVDRIARSIEYVGTLDTTLTGSRNGITPLFLWYAIKQKGVQGFSQMAEGCLDLADYALDQFRKIKWEAWKNKYSNTVVFKRPSAEFIKKWQLASYKDIAHIIVMPHVTKEFIDTFMRDLQESGK
ncbi:MAG: histidine decarboxylase [Candidatus Electrothrix sp. AR4]|nr:histidine decarboxylase [Candidatus Electrothrix sp. AR4]